MFKFDNLGIIVVDMLISYHELIFGPLTRKEASAEGDMFILQYPHRQVGIFVDLDIPDANGGPTSIKEFERPHVPAAFVHNLDGDIVSRFGPYTLQCAYAFRREGLRRFVEVPLSGVLYTLSQHIVHKKHDSDWVLRVLQEPIVRLICHEIRHELQIFNHVKKLRTLESVQHNTSLYEIARKYIEERADIGENPNKRPFETDAIVTELLIAEAWINTISRKKRQQAVISILCER